MDSQRPESVHRRHFTWSITFILMVTTLIWPAFHNGFPLVFYDTGGYLARPFERTLEIGRSVLYGAFLALGSPLDFWPNIVAQAALAAWLVLLALRSHGFGHRPILALFVTLTLAFLTSLPWHAAQLMPDILVPEAVLALYLIAFRRCALRRLEAVLLCAVIAFAIASHMATLGLMLGLLAVALGLQLLGSRLARPQLATPALAVVAGVGLALFSNLAIAGRFTFTPGAATIAFVRLVDHGITKLVSGAPPQVRAVEHLGAVHARQDRRQTITVDLARAHDDREIRPRLIPAVHRRAATERAVRLYLAEFCPHPGFRAFDRRASGLCRTCRHPRSKISGFARPVRFVCASRQCRNMRYFRVAARPLPKPTRAACSSHGRYRRARCWWRAAANRETCEICVMFLDIRNFTEIARPVARGNCGVSQFHNSRWVRLNSLKLLDTGHRAGNCCRALEWRTIETRSLELL